MIQFTPPGFGCSVQFGTNVTSATPGWAQGLYLIVSEIEAARDELIACRVEVSEVFYEGTPGARFHHASSVGGKQQAFGHPQTFAAGPPKNGVQFMVKDSRKYASTGGREFAQFNDGKRGQTTFVDNRRESPCGVPHPTVGKVFVMKASTVLLAAILAIAIGVPTVVLAEDKNAPHSPQMPIERYAHARTPARTMMPSLDGAIGWLNSPPLTAGSLHGKVVVIEFWTYTCINWMRSHPYVRAWAEKYKEQGLVVIGVHSPEFAFEKNVDNVRRAAKDMRVDYPVAIDSNYALWRAFKNEYWPALYFVDAQGHIRHHHFGEGEYGQSEMIIQQLLAEAGMAGIGRELVSVDAQGAEAAADWANLRSPETYVGDERADNFASPGGAVLDKSHVYAAPPQLKLNHWALSGDWTVEKNAIVLNKPNGRITYRFHARDLHLVMAPAAPGASVRFRLLIDGHPPGADHGIDVDEQGNGTVTEPRLYQLIRQRKPVADRQFEIEFLESGVLAFVLTFG